MRTLDEYIAQTEWWRSGEVHSQLFLSVIHKDFIWQRFYDKNIVEGQIFQKMVFKQV